MSGFRWETVAATLMLGDKSIGFVCGGDDEWEWHLDIVKPEPWGREKTLAAAKHALLKAYAIASGVPAESYDPPSAQPDDIDGKDR